MSHPQFPPAPGSAPPSAGAWSGSSPPPPPQQQQQQQPHHYQPHWHQQPQQQPSPFQSYNPQQHQSQPGTQSYGQPYDPSSLSQTNPSPVGAHPPYGQPPPSSSPGHAQSGPAGVPAPGIGVVPGSVAANAAAPGVPPHQGGLMGQVNHAIASGKPYIQTFGNKLGKKFGQFTSGGMSHGQQQAQAAGVYGQPGGPHGQPAQQTQQPPTQQGQVQPGYHPQPPPPQQQSGPYGQPSASHPPAPPATSASAVSPAPAPTPPVEQVTQSIGALGLSASPAAIGSTAPGRKWGIVDAATQQPSFEFRAVATLMFDSLNGQGSREAFVDATKILAAWQANGLDAQWIDLFAYDNYHSFSVMWSLSQIPHVLIPRTQSLVPSTASLGSVPGSFAPASVPAEPGSGKFEAAPLPAYVPALTLGSYINSLFLDFFDNPASLPDLVRKQVGGADQYAAHVQRNPSLPDLAAFDPAVPAILQGRAKAVRAAAVERAMAEVARRRSNAAGAPVAP